MDRVIHKLEKNLKIWKRGEEFFKKVYLTMVTFCLSERLSEAKQGNLRRSIIYLECFHFDLKKYCNRSELKRCFISGHIVMYGIKLSLDILSPFPDQ